MRREGEITGGQRRRHSPEEAERAILAAARAFLSEHPFREMKVEDVMARTGLSRPAFYAYFGDRYELVTRLLEGIGGLLFAVDRRWLVGDPGAGREESVKTLGEALGGGAETFRSYGPVLRAISDASSYDGRVEEVYRFGLLERLVAAVAVRVARDVEAGGSPAGLPHPATAPPWSGRSRQSGSGRSTDRGVRNRDPCVPKHGGQPTMSHPFFALGFALLLVHEMDAVRLGEWKIFPWLSGMGEEAGYRAFTALHVPLYALLLFGLLGGDGVGRAL